MEFPIVYKPIIAKNRGLSIFIAILGVVITAIGIKLRIIMGNEDGSMAALYIGLFFVIMAVLLLLLGSVRAKQEANTSYTVDHDGLILFFGKNEKSESFYYQDYLFTGRVQRVNGSLFCTVVMEDRNGKKIKRTLFLNEESFRSLMDNVTNASAMFQNKAAGV